MIEENLEIPNQYLESPQPKEIKANVVTSNSKSKHSSNKFQSRSEEDHSTILKNQKINFTTKNNNIMERFLDEDCNSDSSFTEESEDTPEKPQVVARPFIFVSHADDKPGLVEEFNSSCSGSNSDSCSVEEVNLFTGRINS